MKRKILPKNKFIFSINFINIITNYLKDEKFFENNNCISLEFNYENKSLIFKDAKLNKLKDFIDYKLKYFMIANSFKRTKIISTQDSFNKFLKNIIYLLIKDKKNESFFYNGKI